MLQTAYVAQAEHKRAAMASMGVPGAVEQQPVHGVHY
jgi:hypothetical protein